MPDVRWQVKDQQLFEVARQNWLERQALLPRAGVEYPISHIGIAFQQTVVHSCQHPDVRIDVVVHLHNLLVIVRAMETPDVWLKRFLPRDRHGEEQRVQTRILDPLADVAAGRQDHSLFVFKAPLPSARLSRAAV